MNKFVRTVTTAALLGMFVPVTGAFADDTDIYAANTSALTNPNILVVIDNSANWAAANQGWPGGMKQGESELRALRTAAAGLAGNINLGLMLLHDGTVDGAYVRYHVRPMNATNKPAFMLQIGGTATASTCTDAINTVSFTPNCIYKNFNAPSEKISAAGIDYSAMMFEVFKYFGGHTSPAKASDPDPNGGSPVDASHFGTMRYSTLPGDITTGTTYLPSQYPVKKYDAAAYSGDTLSYNRLLSAANSCAKNYVVIIGNGAPNQDSPASLLTGVGGDATQVLAPDFVTMSGDVQTLLASNVPYADQATCEAAGAATYPGYTAIAPNKAYTCVSLGTATTTVTLASSSCGAYANAASCATAAATAHPGHGSYSCTVTGNCAGTYPIGTSACGAYASSAACQTALPALYPGYTGFTCTVNGALTCTPATVTLNTGVGNFAAGKLATAAACQAKAAIDYPGYSSYSCTGTGVATTLTNASCYASAAACNTASAALFPGYSAVGCATPVACTSVMTTTCAATTTYNTAAKCLTAAPLLPGQPFARYACAAGANCTGGKTWTITGTKDKYTVTGTGTAWTVTGTTTAGSRYDMSGTGGNTYEMTASDTQAYWDMYGNKNITTAVPTDTYTTTSPNNADEWARFLQQTDVSDAPEQQTVTVFTIDVFKDQQDTAQTKLLMSMARQGGGKYFTATNEDDIKNAFLEIFAEIQSVNSVFASSSLPVSVNTQGTYLNQVFMGMFRPKGSAQPRWSGNLKQYKFKNFAGLLRLADKNGDEAISPTTGFIDPCADSFWSTDTGRYWNYVGSTARGNCRAQVSKGPVANSVSFFSDAPDGDIVEKGGVGQKMRGVTLASGVPVTSTNYLTRKLLTCEGATNCTVLAPFDSTNTTLTSTAFGIALKTASYQTSFIDWVRGKDADDERVNTPPIKDEVRPSVHGGVVHAQPAVIDYGALGVVAFYGSDDGVFHAITGGQTDADGNELWGFIAPEHYSFLNRLRVNYPVINLPGVTAVSAKPKDYGFDGGIGVYQNNSKVWIFPAMRRGGRSIYAFDVSDPANPIIKWRKGCFTNDTTIDTSCSASWSGIGQTWSKPNVTYLKGYANPVLIFGGGYDTCEDVNSQTRCATTPRKGANIWFVDAFTGSIIKTYSTHYSVPGDLTLLVDLSGFVTHVYAGDTGGYVYRINVGSYDGVTLPSTATGWSANSAATDIDLAYLSQPAVIPGGERKFLNGVTVVQYAGFNAVLAGSGDREHPMANNYPCVDPVTNQFYMLLDRPNSYPATIVTATDLVNVNSGSAIFDKVAMTITNSSGSVSSKGWKFDFSPCEQAVNKGLVVAGIAYFGTNKPIDSTSACKTNLGEARGYAVKFLTGNANPNSPRSAIYTGGGMPPSPEAGIADIDGEMQPFCIGCIETSDVNASSLQVGKQTINPPASRFRSYWYIEND